MRVTYNPFYPVDDTGKWLLSILAYKSGKKDRSIDAANMTKTDKPGTG